MKKDKEWLKDELLRELMRFNDNPNMADYEIGIASGIGTAINLTEKLDEPEKPVIPQFVADWVERWEDMGLTLCEWFEFHYENEEDNEITRWLYNNDDNKENTRREYLLVDAIRNGYEVEKEKLYRVRMPKTDSVLTLESGEYYFDDVLSWMGEKPDIQQEFTEAEIESIDQLYWIFAEEVKE